MPSAMRKTSLRGEDDKMCASGGQRETFWKKFLSGLFSKTFSALRGRGLFLAGQIK
jgi:hypothetical protein